MSNRPVYVVSDVHLGAVPEARAVSFVRWLRRIRDDASRLVVNGDLFDFWFEYGSVIPRGHTRVLGALAEVVDAGVPVDFLGGNHDWWGGSFLEEEIGVAFHREPVTLRLNGLRTFVAHGDGLGSGDLGYRMLKRVLRSRLSRWGFRWLHPDVGAMVARRVSLTEERAAGHVGAAEARARTLAEWARKKLRSEPDLDMVVLGHTHVPQLEEVEPGRYYVNAGDWVNHRSYLAITVDGVPRLREWEDVGG